MKSETMTSGEVLTGSTGRKLRIALVSYRSKPHSGGQGIYVSYLSRALKGLGHDVTVISGEPYPVLDKDIPLVKLPGMNFYEYPTVWESVKERGIRSFTDFFELVSFYSGGFPEMYTFGRRLVKYMKSHGHEFDIIHDNQSLCCGLLKLMKMDIPVVTTIHHPITRDLRLELEGEPKIHMRLLARRWHSFLWMQKKVAPRIPKVITVSECSKNDIINDFQVKEAKFDVVYNGVDLDQFAPMPEIKKTPFRIMATASADVPLKGLAYLLKAVASLKNEFPEISLTVLGKPKPDGPTAPLLKRLNIKKHVRFVSGVSTSELRRLYAKASIAVVPSLYEGFGLPVAEAMACGCPVISTTGGALPEVVGDAGLLVPPGDENALADAIRKLLLDPDLRAGFSTAGRERMEETFNWTAAARETVKAYHDILGKARFSARRPGSPATAADTTI